MIIIKMYILYILVMTGGMALQPAAVSHSLKSASRCSCPMAPRRAEARVCESQFATAHAAGCSHTRDLQSAIAMLRLCFHAAFGKAAASCIERKRAASHCNEFPRVSARLSGFSSSREAHGVFIRGVSGYWSQAAARTKSARQPKQVERGLRAAA